MKKTKILLLLLLSSILLVSCKKDTQSSEPKEVQKVETSDVSKNEASPSGDIFEKYKLPFYNYKSDLEEDFLIFSSGEKDEEVLEETFNVQVEETAVEKEEVYEEALPTNEREKPDESTFNSLHETNEEMFHTAPFEQTLYASSELYVRNYPSYDGKIKYLVYKSSPIKMSGICDNGWYEITYNDEKLYAPMEFFTSYDEITLERNLSQSNSYGYLFDDGLGDEELKIVESTLDLLPSNVKCILEDEGWKIYTTSREIGELFDFGSMHINALTLFDRKEIWISKTACTAQVIAHEIGHFIDGAYMSGSNNEAFLFAFNSEKNNLSQFDDTNLHNYATPDEYFAECYSMILTRASELYTYCPKTFEYMSAYLIANNLV